MAEKVREVEQHLKVIGSQFVDQAALANIGDANHKQGAVRSLSSMPSDHKNVFGFNAEIKSSDKDLSSAPTSLDTVGMMAAVSGQ